MSYVDLDSPVAAAIVTVRKMNGGYGVYNHRDEIVVAYKNKKFAVQYAEGEIQSLFNAAEIENDRRDAIAAYLHSRKFRPVKEKAQLELF